MVLNHLDLLFLIPGRFYFSAITHVRSFKQVNTTYPYSTPNDKMLVLLEICSTKQNAISGLQLLQYFCVLSPWEVCPVEPSYNKINQCCHRIPIRKVLNQLMSSLGGAQKQRKMIQLHLNSNLLFHRRRRTLRHVSPSHVIRHRLTTSGNGLSSRITCRFIWQVRDHVSRLRQPAEFFKFLTIALLEVIAFHRKTRMLYRFARPAGLVLHSLEPTQKISSLWRCFISNWFRSSEAIYNVLPGPWYSNRLHAGRTLRSRLPTLLRTLMFRCLAIVESQLLAVFAIGCTSKITVSLVAGVTKHMYVFTVARDLTVAVITSTDQCGYIEVDAVTTLFVCS